MRLVARQPQKIAEPFEVSACRHLSERASQLFNVLRNFPGTGGSFDGGATHRLP